MQLCALPTSGPSHVSNAQPADLVDAQSPCFPDVGPFQSPDGHITPQTTTGSTQLQQIHSELSRLLHELLAAIGGSPEEELIKDGVREFITTMSCVKRAFTEAKSTLESQAQPGLYVIESDRDEKDHVPSTDDLLYSDFRQDLQTDRRSKRR